MDTKDIMIKDSINEGLSLLEKGEYNEAMDIFMKTRRIYPKAHEVWWVIGCCYYTENDKKESKEALDAFLKVIELKATARHEYKDNDWIKFSKLKWQLCGNYDAALPMDENIYYLLARTYFFNCKYKEAIEYYLKSIEIIESKSWYRANGYPDYYKHIEGYIGDAYMEMGQIKEAIEHFQASTKHIRTAGVKLAKVYCLNGQFKEAEETLLKTIEEQKKIGFVFTDGDTPYDLLIELYSTNKEYEKLIDLYLKGLGNPYSNLSYLGWMELEDKYKLEGLYKKTIDCIINMAEEEKEKLNNYKLKDIMGLLGISSYKIDNIEAAIDGFQKCVEEYHQNYFIWRLLGISYLLQEKYAEGLEALLTANALGDDDIVNKYWLGAAYMLNEQFERAIKLFWEIAKSESFKSCKIWNEKKALESIDKEPSGVGVWFMLATSYMRIGDYEKAKKSLLRANELNPEDNVIKELLEKVENLLKE